jgi:hypothetical protein
MRAIQETVFVIRWVIATAGKCSGWGLQLKRSR